MQLESSYQAVFVFVICGVGFVLAPFFVSYLMAPSKPNSKKLSIYECGEVPVGTAWIQYNVRYYFFAMIFLVFDVETIFMFPWAVTIRDIGPLAITEMFIFLGILFFGLVYAWKKGALEWF